MTGVARDRCAVCNARFRSASVCSRCGADLRPLLSLAVRAWAARNEARAALLSGDWQGAARQAELAQWLCASDAGAGLRALALLAALK